MRDDLVEVVAAMVERRRQILAEEPVEDAGAAHQRQRQTHQPPRALENQHRQQGADHEIEPRRIAVARDQVGVEDPLIQPAQKSGAADQPAGRAADIAPGGEVADQAEGHQDQEADVNAAHHLARQVVEGRDIELKDREQDADRIGEMSPAAGAEALRKSVLEIVEFDLDGRLSVHSLQHSCRSPAPRSSDALYHRRAAPGYVMRGLDPRIQPKVKFASTRRMPGICANAQQRRRVARRALARP